MTALDSQLRQQLSDLLQHGNAHMSFEEVVADFPESKINSRPDNVDYTFWHLVEHLRITQKDILAYLNDPNYHEMEWPKDYWSASDATTDKAGWDDSVAAFLNDRRQLVAIAKDSALDLASSVPSNPEHTVLRCLLVIADHNAYHIGELGVLRQVDDAWGRR